jgi:site-specific recombinase XerD
MLLRAIDMRSSATPLASAIDSYLLNRTDWSDSMRRWATNYMTDFSGFVTARQRREAQISDLELLIVSGYVAHKKLTSLHSGRAAAVVLKGLGKFCDEFGILEGNPLAKLRVPKPPEDVRQPLKDEEVKRLLLAAGDCPRPAQAARDQALVALVLDTAIRFNEVRLLELDDIDFERRVLTVRSVTSKGQRRTREIRIGATATRYLDRYLKDYRPNVEREVLFLTVDGKPLRRGGLDTLFDRLETRSGVKFSAHILRHTSLTNDRRNKHDLIEIGAKAGWSRRSLEKMALRYTSRTEIDELSRTTSLDQLVTRRAS